MEILHKDHVADGCASVPDLSRLYHHRFTESQSRQKRQLWQVLVQDWLQAYITPRDTVLDLGGGSGEFISAVRCAEKILVDVNPSAGQGLAADVKVIRTRVDDLAAIEKARVDVVFASNLFEHLANTNELLDVLKEAHRVLRVGGCLLILQPNIRFAYREYWDFLDHHLPLSDRSLQEALAYTAFDVEVCVPQFLPYSTKHGLPKSSWLLKAYLRMPWAWRMFGKQLFIVAKKRILE